MVEIEGNWPENNNKSGLRSIIQIYAKQVSEYNNNFKDTINSKFHDFNQLNVERKN